MDFSPRLDRRLADAVCRADVERASVADVWRSVGETAGRLGLCRPGYHSVRRLVLEERERRAARREAIADAVGELWSYTGTDYEALATRLARSARR
jgi:hypothetical protein